MSNERCLSASTISRNSLLVGGPVCSARNLLMECSARNFGSAKTTKPPEGPKDWQPLIIYLRSIDHGNVYFGITVLVTLVPCASHHMMSDPTQKLSSTPTTLPTTAPASVFADYPLCAPKSCRNMPQSRRSMLSHSVPPLCQPLS